VSIPFLNAKKFIVETAESVCSQTHDNWKLLLVNDGSTDRGYGDRLHEGDRMSIAHIERLLGWDMDESNETNFRAMSSLLFGRETDLDPRAAQKAAKDIQRLHPPFCQEFGILRKQCTAHRAELASHMGRRIIEIAHASFDRGDYRAARQFLFEACRL
jgi:hypothetical protein